MAEFKRDGENWQLIMTPEETWQVYDYLMGKAYDDELWGKTVPWNDGMESVWRAMEYVLHRLEGERPVEPGSATREDAILHVNSNTTEPWFRPMVQRPPQWTPAPWAILMFLGGVAIFVTGLLTLLIKLGAISR